LTSEIAHFGSNVLVSRIVLGELQRNAQHVETEKCHPSGTVGLTQLSASGQGLGTVEGSDIVETEETALEYIVALRVLPVDPPECQLYSLYR
jgi:hypothetical protein